MTPLQTKKTRTVLKGKLVIFAPLEAPSGIGMEVITIFRFSDYSHLSDELLFWPQTHFTGRANVDDLGYSNKNSNVLNMPQSRGRPICVFQGRYRYRLLQIK